MIEKYQIGKYQLLTLLDGIFLCDTHFIPAAKSAEGEKLFTRAGLPDTGPSPEPINAFVLEDDGRLWLIDAGCGRALGPRFGKAVAGLKNAGYQPDQIEGIILSHLHEDHIGGLLREDGSALYPRATLYLSETEFAFWTDPNTPSDHPHLKESGLLALISGMFAAYKGAITTIPDQGEVMPGVSLVPLPGHTPGHSGIEINDGGQRLLIWGDVVHSTLLQLRYPHWSISFDMNPPQARETRENLLARLAKEQTLVAGPHVTGLGTIRPCCEGGYQLVDPR